MWLNGLKSIKVKLNELAETLNGVKALSNIKLEQQQKFENNQG